MQLDYDYLSRIRRAVALYTKKKTSNILDGEFHSIHRGRSMEFDDLKEYTFGDDVHDIDWKSASRMGNILVRRYMTERRHNCMFICDCGHKMTGSTPSGQAKDELALMTFGTLAYITGRNGADCSLAYPDGNKAAISLFSSGPDHVDKLMHAYGSNVDKNQHISLNQVLHDVVSTVHKKMIIFFITDMEGLDHLDGNLIRGITADNDLLIINIEDAFLTGKVVYDVGSSLYERFFFSRNKELHDEEVRIHEEIMERASLMCKLNRTGLCSIGSEDKIIDTVIDLLERYRHGYYGFVKRAI